MNLDPKALEAALRAWVNNPKHDASVTDLIGGAIAAYLAAAPAPVAPAGVSAAIVKHMVGRFLSWKLPEHFNPDAGISFKREFNENTPWPMKHEPIGTNLFDASQAEAMVRHMLDGLPPPASLEMPDLDGEVEAELVPALLRTANNEDTNPNDRERLLRAARLLRDKWRTPGQKVDSDDFFAAIHALSEAVDALDDAAAPQPIAEPKGGDNGTGEAIEIRSATEIREKQKEHNKPAAAPLPESGEPKKAFAETFSAMTALKQELPVTESPAPEAVAVEWDGLFDRLPDTFMAEIDAWMDRIDKGDYSTEQVIAHVMLGERNRRSPLPAAPKPDRAAVLEEAARDVIAERQRQKEVEGWTPEHDDEHDTGELARAAACYAEHTALCGKMSVEAYREQDPPRTDHDAGVYPWPWGREWWKPTDRRRDLIKAGALIIAEIERLDRALAKGADHVA